MFFSTNFKKYQEGIDKENKLCFTNYLTFYNQPFIHCITMFVIFLFVGKNINFEVDQDPKKILMGR